MSSIIPINLAVEDSLSEAVLRKMLLCSGREYAVGTAFNRGGSGYLRRMIGGFNSAAKGTPFLVLADLDRTECAPILVSEWLNRPLHHNLLFRIAVKEVEAWILADSDAFARFFGLRRQIIPEDPDAVDDPKRFLVDLVRKCRRRALRVDIVPPQGSTSQVGRNYSGRLTEFVLSAWDPEVASTRSRSLARAWRRVAEFEPIWQRR